MLIFFFKYVLGWAHICCYSRTNEVWISSVASPMCNKSWVYHQLFSLPNPACWTLASKQ